MGCIAAKCIVPILERRRGSRLYTLSLHGRAIIEQLGVQLDIAASGSAGLEKLRSSRVYNLVIIDLMLPDMSGYAVCSAYKDYCFQKGVDPAFTLALTAEAVPEASPPSDFGFSRCLLKPLSSATVLKLFEEFATFTKNSLPAEATSTAVPVTSLDAPTAFTSPPR